MSRLIRITTESEEAVSAATLETILQVRGVTTVKYELAGFRVSADYATDATGIVQWYLAYQSTDGTATGTTEVPGSADDPTPAITGFRHFTAEPTPGSFVDHGEFNCNGGEAMAYWADGDGVELDNATSSRLALVVTSDKACNIAASMLFRVLAA